MKVTAQDLKGLGVIDTIIPEPLGGAHRDPAAAIASLGDAVSTALDDLGEVDASTRRQQRREKFLAMGRF
jgi:acetyl-CoA carboxylase carboxyl transferase subunit alpha